MAQVGEYIEVPNVVRKVENRSWNSPGQENLEWRDQGQENSGWSGSGQGEVICGVANDCIIFPNQSTHVVVTDVPQTQATEVVQYAFTDQDFLDIQVTEEEVVASETWDNGQPPDDESQHYVELKVACNPTLEAEDIEIPLPQDQDAYTTMRPYPCDFCSRRFRKKANLMNHMVAHQTDRPHGCNLCGARYRRKCDLINHMKIHAYAPGHLGTDDEDEETHTNNSLENDNNASLKGRRKKAQSAAPKKRKNAATTSQNSNYIDDDDDNSIHLKDFKRSNHSSTPSRKKHGSSGSGSYSYVDEDMRLLSQPPPTFTPSMEPQEPAVPRWPVVDESRPYVCQHCGVGFAREKALASHARVHAGDSPFECNTCGEMFWDVGLLKEHSRIKHAGRSRDESDASGPYTGDDRFGEFHCEICGLGFHRQDLLKRHCKVHVKIEPNIMSEHVCQVCGQTFEEQSDLLTHAETHARYQPHRCMLCGECFVDAQAVASHVRRRHSRNIPPNACTLCGKTCKDRRSLQKHAWVHSAERSFSCHKCGKRFHSRARLKRHMVSHRDKAVSCDECGLEFPDGRALINHRHSHNKEPSARQFECAECGKTFGSRSSQQIHARIHTGERPYGCRFCWKAFADGGTLRKHERIHTGEKPYACAVCPRAFNQRVVLREHIRSHHSGPEPRSSHSHAPVYVCKVCAAAFSSSEQLCAHLIQHSDENTAKQRMPKLGPRKYKRRRKLNSHELTLLSNVASSTRDVSAEREPDSEDDAASLKRKIAKKKYKQKGKSNTDENFQSVVKSFESVIENLNSIVSHTKTEPGKGKLDKKKHKTKRRPGADGRYGMNNSKSRTNVTSGGFVKSTRPAGERRVRPRTKNVTVSTLAALKSVTPKQKVDSKHGKEGGRVGPRTKNVNYHNVKMAKLPSATFPGKSKSERNSNQDKTESHKEKPIRSTIKAEYDKAVPIVFEPAKEVKVEFTCEMCSETFTKRSELLVHVPIHI